MIAVPCFSCISSSLVDGQTLTLGFRSGGARSAQARSHQGAVVAGGEHRLERPERQQLADQHAFVLGREAAVGTRLAEHGEHQRRARAVHVGGRLRPGGEQAGELGRSPRGNLQRLRQRAAAELGRAMARQQRDEGRHVRFEAPEQRAALGVEALGRIELLPQRRDARPLRMWIERVADGGAELDAQPRHGVGIAEIDAEHEGARQADDADQAERRGDAHARHRPEVGDDLGDPTLPHRPQIAVGSVVPLPRLQHGSQRRHEIEQRGALVPHFVDERGGDPAPHHPLARHLDDGGRIAAAARQPRARAPDRRPGSAFEVAEDGREFIEPARQGERISGNDVETGQPRPVVLFASLRDGVAEHVELVEHCVEPQAQDGETALRLFRCRQRLRSRQPAKKAPDETPELPSSFDHRPLDGGLRVGERLAAGTIGSSRANGLMRSSRVMRARASSSRIRAASGPIGMTRHTPNRTMRWPRRTQRPDIARCPAATPMAPPAAPTSPGANLRAAARAADCAAARGSAPAAAAAAAWRAVSAAMRTNWRAPSNSSSSPSPSPKVSASSPIALPAALAKPAPIFAPSGPPTQPPSAVPAIGKAFLATLLSTPPIALPSGDLAIWPTVLTARLRKLPRNCSSSCSLLTARSSWASWISSCSLSSSCIIPDPNSWNSNSSCWNGPASWVYSSWVRSMSCMVVSSTWLQTEVRRTARRSRKPGWVGVTVPIRPGA